MKTMTARQRGFTILEMLISLSLFLVVMATVLSTLVPSQRLHATGERQSDIQQNARLAMTEMTKQIRMAGYFPENFADPAPSPLLDDAVVFAGSSALAIHGDIDGTGTSNVFLFCLDGETLRRTRGAIDEAGTYDCSDGEVLAQNTTSLLFTFYDANGAVVPDPPTPPFSLDEQAPEDVPSLDDTSLRGTVRRVVVSLTTRTELPGQRTRDYTLSSEVVMRNVR